MVWATKHFRAYLYGHPCDVYTNHKALQALLNTPHPSGKLARWGMALQEMDLHLHYQPGKTNQNADTLSRTPIGTQAERSVDTEERLVATLAVPEVSDKYGKRIGLAKSQMSDDELRPVIEYLKNVNLPAEEKAARELVLSKQQYVLIDDVLHHLVSDGTLWVMPPVKTDVTLSRRLMAAS